MYNTRYLPENFEQCRLEKTILRHFPINLNVRSSWNALNQDGGETMKRLISAAALIQKHFNFFQSLFEGSIYFKLHEKVQI